jgi:serine/threonine protein phosphatase PrpC
VNIQKQIVEFVKNANLQRQVDKSPKIAHIDSSKENSTTAVLRLIGFNGSEIGATNIK